MSDIMDDLRKVEGPMNDHPITEAERISREENRSLAARYLAKHAPDLHEMIMGVPLGAI